MLGGAVLERQSTPVRRANRRHPAFRPFREEIAEYLPLANRLDGAARDSAEERKAALAEFVRVWNESLATHLATTEHFLLPLTSSPEHRRRALTEGRLLRSMALEAPRFRADPDPDPIWTGNLAARLRGRLRWEDGTWFPAIEQTVAVARLAVLASDMARYRMAQSRADA
jgi:hypothetical protein